jgi:hypothetical protein
VAILAYFRRHQQRRLWPHVVAPALAFAGMPSPLTIVIHNFQYLSGSKKPVVNWVPIAIPVAMAGGMLFALWLRKFKPQQFAAILRTDT